ncbi:MAG: tetratricopeptide repeat protein [Fimbriimonadales bacterium]|nr:tetratricopeptide repeat protein [Fimbriimonadales bacterium]
MRWVCGLLAVGIALTGCGKKETARPEQALLEQGKQKLEARDYAGAAEVFKQFVEQSPDLTQALQAVYTAYMTQPNRPAAQAYEFLVQYEPRASEIKVTIDRAGYYQVLGSLAFLSGRRTEYARWFEKSLELDPNNHLAMNDYAYALAEDNRDLEKALRLIRRALAIKSNVGAYYDTYGWVLYRLGRYEEALRALRTAVQTAPDTADLRYHLAAVYAKLGKKDDALVELEKALALQPGHEQAQRLRQALLGERKQ